MHTPTYTCSCLSAAGALPLCIHWTYLLRVNDLLSSASWDPGHSIPQTQCSGPLESGTLPHSTATEVDPMSRVAKRNKFCSIREDLNPTQSRKSLEYFSRCCESCKKSLKPFISNKQALCTLGSWDHFFTFETQSRRTHLQSGGAAPRTSGARLHCFSAAGSRYSSVFDKRKFTWCLQGMKSLSRAFLI